MIFTNARVILSDAIRDNVDVVIEEGNACRAGIPACRLFLGHRQAGALALQFWRNAASKSAMQS
jgi:hypothetical protein